MSRPSTMDVLCALIGINKEQLLNQSQRWTCPRQITFQCTSATHLDFIQPVETSGGGYRPPAHLPLPLKNRKQIH